ncbi:MAG TPA: hypothetical protein VGO79_03770 [Thermoanaerobaculia bacterium]|jgi:hypothetical protein
MNVQRPAALTLGFVLMLASAPGFAAGGGSDRSGAETPVLRAAQGVRQIAGGPNLAGIAQLNIVTKVQGTAAFRTAVDVSNNTNTEGIHVQLQYCYTFNGAFVRCSDPYVLALAAFSTFHTTDVVDLFGTNGLIPADAAASSFGTLFAFFDHLPSQHGWEITLSGRTYSNYSATDPSLGTLAIAYPGSDYSQSASQALVGVVHDTRANPTAEGALRTNLGITNTDINVVGAVNVTIHFIDTTDGSPTKGLTVGNVLAMNGLQTGEVRQINDVFGAAHIPGGVTDAMVIAGVTGSPAHATIEGYIDTLSSGTQDGAYIALTCMDDDGCGN